MIAAVSQDRKISRKGEEARPSFEWTSPEDKRRFKALTKAAGVVVMGHKTYMTCGGKPLRDRLNIVYTNDEALLQTPWTDELGYTNDPPEVLLEKLQLNGHLQVFICGGTKIYDLFAPFMDYLYLTVEPLEFGEDGTPLFTNPSHMPTCVLKSEEVITTRFVFYNFE